MYSKSVSGLSKIKASSIEVSSSGDPINISEGKKFGILAQQIQRVMPDSVVDCDGTLKVEYLDLIGVLLGAVKGLSSEITELKKKIQ